MSINEIIPSDAFILQVIGIGALILMAVLCYGYRAELRGVGRALLSRYVTMPTLADIADAPITPRQDAVNEIAETPKSPGLDPAQVDGMIAAAVESARWEARASAVGTLEGRGLLAPSSRSKALDALGIRGERYTRLKPLADAAQAAAQSEAAPPPPPAPPILVYAGRPEAREIPREPALDCEAPSA